MLPRGWSLIYIDFDNGALRYLIGAQLIKQQQLRGELRNMQMRNEILMDFLCQWFDYKGSDLGSLSISHWAVFTEYPPHPSPPTSLPSIASSLSSAENILSPTFQCSFTKAAVKHSWQPVTFKSADNFQPQTCQNVWIFLRNHTEIQPHSILGDENISDHMLHLSTFTHL